MARLVVCIMTLVGIALAPQRFFTTSLSSRYSSVRHNASMKPAAPSFSFSFPAYVIVLRPETYDPVPLSSLRAVSGLTVVRANNGTEAALSESLPLYTRHILRHGRSEHGQLGNPAALGCLLSHRAIWKEIARLSRPALVFEEDALVSDDTDFKLDQFLNFFLSADAKGPEWDLLLLDTAHLNTGGRWGQVGPHAANCTEPDGSCTWFGTRAYLIRPAATLPLLKHSEPPLVQVDAVITLVAEFYGRSPTGAFKMYWTRMQIFGYNMLRPSTIFDGCVKCYLPAIGISYVAILCVFVSFYVILHYVKMVRRPLHS